MEEKMFGAKMVISEKFHSEYNSKLFTKQLLLEALQVQFKSNSTNFLFQSAHAYRLVGQIFGTKMATSEKVLIDK